jgi:NADH:ubiquinone oxidoreductase subunit
MIATRLLIWLKGQYVGEDCFGNRYYQEKFLFSKPNRPPRRWVYYRGEAEASKVPSEWHGWLHFTHEAPLAIPPYKWQKPHQPNLSGTSQAYRPPQSATQGSFPSTPKRYEAWQPLQKEAVE